MFYAAIAYEHLRTNLLKVCA